MIIGDQNINVSKNFTEKEYFSAAYGNFGYEFYLSDEVVKGGQIIREYFNVPMKVTASYRTPEHDISKGRSGTGTHTKGKASDFVFLDNGETLLKYHEEIINRGPLYKLLREAGINGIGLYDNFLHIDSRESGNTQDQQYGPFGFWDNRTWSKKKTLV